MTTIRAQVLGALRRPDTDEYLVQGLHLPGEPTVARRFIGGGIRFGETSDDALEREFREELGVAVEAGPVVGTVENVYTWDGERAHELAVIRTGRFADESLYDRETFRGVDDGGAFEYEADWRLLADLLESPEPFYPEGVADLFGEDGGVRHLVSADD